MLKVATYLDVDIFYDPEKHCFCAEVHGKKLHHKKQIKLEALIKQWNDKLALAEEKRKAVKIRKVSESELKPKRKYTRRQNKGKVDVDAGIPAVAPAGGLPADLVKHLDDIDSGMALIRAKVDRFVKEKNPPALTALIHAARQQLHVAENAIKLIVQLGYAVKDK